MDCLWRLLLLLLLLWLLPWLLLLLLPRSSRHTCRQLLHRLRATRLLS
jgi:hypothetical protein